MTPPAAATGRAAAVLPFTSHTLPAPAQRA